MNYYKHPYVSSSMLKKALKSPAWLGIEEPDTEALVLGSILHERFFSGKTDVIVCPVARRSMTISRKDEVNFDPKFPTESYLQKSHREGRAVVLRHPAQSIFATAEDGLKYLADSGFNKEFQWIEREFYDDERQFKAKIDATFVDDDGKRVLVDLKSTSLGLEVPESAFYESLKYSYDLQMAHYLDVIRGSGEEIDRAELWFLSKTKNHKLVRLELDERFLEMGLELRDLALKLLARKQEPRYYTCTLSTGDKRFQEFSCSNRVNHYRTLHGEDAEETEQEETEQEESYQPSAWAKEVIKEMEGENG